MQGNTIIIASDIRSRHNKGNKSSPKLAFEILLCLWLLLLGFQLCKVWHTPVWRDDATFAQVAKNIALGHGYAVASFDRLFPFAWGISSGPAVILPAAFMIMLFGNGYWVPGLTCVILINLLLLYTFRQLRFLIKTDVIRWQSFSLFLLAAMLTTNHLTGFPGERMHLWHALMGEIPSALLVINAVLFIARDRDNPKILLMGGLIASLGALCKMQALIGTGIFGVYLALYYCARRRARNFSWQQVAARLSIYGIAVALPLISFEIIKLFSLGGWDNYLANNSRLHSVSHAILSFADMEMVCRKICELGEYLGVMEMPESISLSFLIFLVVMIFIYAKLVKSYAGRFISRLASPVTDAEWAADALWACCIGHIAGWFFLSPLDMPRYATQGLLYGCAALALFMSRQMAQDLSKGTRNLLIFAAMIVGLRYDAMIYLASGLKPNANLQEQQEVVQKLISIKHARPGTVIFSCGYTFELEYLLPDSANFIRCEKLDDPAYSANSKLLLSFTIDNTGRLMDYDDSQFHVIFHPNLTSARAACPRDDIFASRHYFIASCPRE